MYSLVLVEWIPSAVLDELHDECVQVELLVERAEEMGANIRRLRFPDRGTPLGKLIDMYLKVRSCALSL